MTIPQDIRDVAGFHPGTEVDFFMGDDGVVRVVAGDRAGRADALAAMIARLRGSADIGLTTDEVMALARE